MPAPKTELLEAAQNINRLRANFGGRPVHRLQKNRFIRGMRLESEQLATSGLWWRTDSNRRFYTSVFVFFLRRAAKDIDRSFVGVTSSPECRPSPLRDQDKQVPSPIRERTPEPVQFPLPGSCTHMTDLGMPRTDAHFGPSQSGEQAREATDKHHA